MNSSRFSSLIATAVVGFALGLAVGCTAEFDANQENVFFCQSDQDCVTPFVCNVTERVCQRAAGSQPVEECVDADQDGVGVGTNRTGCRFPAFEDCDDTNAAVNQQAEEVCDGIDNNCDNNIDVVACQTDQDCPKRNLTDPEGNPVRYTCELTTAGSMQCVARGIKQICLPPESPCPECRNILSCTNGRLDSVPAQCR